MNREQQVGGTSGGALPGSEQNREKRNGKDIGPIGTTARIVVGVGLVGSVIHGQLSVHLAPTSLHTRPHRLPRSRAGLAGGGFAVHEGIAYLTYHRLQSKSL